MKRVWRYKFMAAGSGGLLLGSIIAEHGSWAGVALGVSLAGCVLFGAALWHFGLRVDGRLPTRAVVADLVRRVKVAEETLGALDGALQGAAVIVKDGRIFLATPSQAKAGGAEWFGTFTEAARELLLPFKETP